MTAAIVSGPESSLRFRADPLLFGKAVLGRRRWVKQEEMRLAIETHRRIRVQSANSVGKTHELASIICEWLPRNKGGRVICTGPTFDQVRAGLWQEVKRCWFDAAARDARLSQKEIGESEWELAPGWDAAIVAVDNISAMQGRRGPKVLVVLDEAQGVEYLELMPAIDSLLTAEASRWIAAGNPLWPVGWFYERLHDPDWHTIRISAFEHPNVVEGREVIPGSVTRMWIEEKRREWGEASREWQARVLGEYPEAGPEQFVSRAELQACLANPVKVKAPKSIGLDVARFGGDRNVMGFFDEERILQDVQEWAGQDLMQTAGRLRSAMTKFGVDPRYVCIDGTGIGAGVVDRCREEGLRVTQVDFGGKPEGDWSSLLGRESHHKNRKGELHHAAQRLVRERMIQIPEKWPYVWGDLTALKVDFDAAGRFGVEDKESFRKRCGRSPDYSDMVVIALAARDRTPRIW